MGKAKPRQAKARARKNRRQRASLRTRLPRPASLWRGVYGFLKRKRRKLAFVAGSAVLVSAAVVSLMWLASSSRFDIKRVEAHGQRWLPMDALRARLGIDSPSNLFLFDTKAAAERISESPWVKEVAVTRMFPDGVRVELVENEPVAVALIGELYLVDRDGAPFKQATIREAARLELLIITGITREMLAAAEVEAKARIAQAVELASNWKSNTTRPEIGEIAIDAVRGFTLIPKSGAPAIRVGDGQLEEVAKRAALFDEVWAALGPAEKSSATFLHLDTSPDPSRVAIAFASSAEESPEREKKQHPWAN